MQSPVQQGQATGSLVHGAKQGFLCSHCPPPIFAPSPPLSLNLSLAPPSSCCSHFSSMEVLGGLDRGLGGIPGLCPQY